MFSSNPKFKRLHRLIFYFARIDYFGVVLKETTTSAGLYWVNTEYFTPIIDKVDADRIETLLVGDGPFDIEAIKYVHDIEC